MPRTSTARRAPAARRCVGFARTGAAATGEGEVWASASAAAATAWVTAAPRAGSWRYSQQDARHRRLQQEHWQLVHRRIRRHCHSSAPSTKCEQRDDSARPRGRRARESTRELAGQPSPNEPAQASSGRTCPCALGGRLVHKNLAENWNFCEGSHDDLPRF